MELHGWILVHNLQHNKYNMKNKLKILIIIAFWLITLTAMATTSQVGGIAVSSTTNAFTLGSGTTSVTFNTSGTGATIAQSGINHPTFATIVASGTLASTVNYGTSTVTTGTTTLYLPPSSVVGASTQSLKILNQGNGTSASVIVVTAQGSDTINGASTYTITNAIGQSAVFSTDGSGVWWAASNTISYNWIGTSGSWSQIANWMNGYAANSNHALATFPTTTGTVTLNQPVTLGRLTFTGGPPVFNSGTLTLANSGSNAVINTVSGTANIGSAVVGSVGLTSTGAGRLNITGSASYTGSTSVLGANIYIQGPFGTSGTYAAPIYLGGGSIEFDGNYNITLTGNASGGNYAINRGTATQGYILTMAGSNTYTGATYLNSGGMSISSNANLGSESTGATLQMGLGSACTLYSTTTFGLYNGTPGTNNRSVNLNTTAGQANVFDVTTGATFTIPGNITGGGGFTKTDLGNLKLSGSNTFTGGVSHAGGYLEITSSNALGTGTCTISGSANQLRLDSGRTVSNPITVTSAVSGLAGNGLIQILDSSNCSLTGSVSINANTSAGGTFGTNGGTLTIGPLSVAAGCSGIARIGNIVINGPVSAVGGLIVSQGVMTLTSSNASSSSTSVGASGSSTLVLNHPNAAGSGQITTQITTYLNTLTLGATGTFPNALTINGTTTITTGTFTPTMSGLISGTAPLTVSGSGILTLSASNTFSGGVTLNGGTLAWTTGGTTAPFGSGTLSIAGTSTLLYSGTTNTTITQPTTVSSGFTIANPSNVTCNFSGPINLGGGSYPINLNTTGNISSTILSGAITNGNLVTTGTSYAYLTSNSNTYTNTTINGTYQNIYVGAAGASGVLGSGSLTISAGCNCAMQNTSGATWSMAISGSGGIVGKSGTLTLPSTYTFTGGLSASGVAGACAINLTGTVASAVTVTSGTFMGTGKAAACTVPNTATSILMGGTGITTPGNLTFTGNLVFSGASANLNVGSNGTTTVSTITVGGTTALGGCKINVLNTLSVGVYNIIVGTGAMSGTLPVLGTNSSGRTIVFSQVGNNLVMTAT